MSEKEWKQFRARVDPLLKEQCAKLAEDIGLGISDIVGRYIDGIGKQYFILTKSKTEDVDIDKLIEPINKQIKLYFDKALEKQKTLEKEILN